jgi:hypothetical protein
MATFLANLFTWLDKALGEWQRSPVEVDHFPSATPEQEAQIEAWVKDRQDHAMPLEMICTTPPVIGNGEEVIFCLPNVDLMEPRAVRYSQRQSQGAYGGSSVRIAKGFSIRTGGYGGTSQSQSESVDELRTIDRGTLTLTSKRLVFLGAKRTSNTKLKDIITVEATYQDAFEVHRERKDKAETYQFNEPMQIQEGSGQYLGVFPWMACLSIKLAKIDDDVGPETVAACRASCENKFKLEAIREEMVASEKQLAAAIESERNNISKEQLAQAEKQLAVIRKELMKKPGEEASNVVPIR